MEIATQILHELRSALLLSDRGWWTGQTWKGVWEAKVAIDILYSLLEKFLLITPDPVPETPPPGSLVCPSREPCFFSDCHRPTSSSGQVLTYHTRICDLKTKGCPSPRTPG